jgi:hypothetical protein
MNERIKELACQAHGAANYGDLRFAELILQDCIKLVADAVDHREPASTYVDKIKQHFGMTPLRQDNWQQYAKEGETAQDVIERERADCAALLELYKKLKQQL